ncbi:hypothetical protein O3P69_009247 [Scylla paramamosain]|uniref:UTP--glucose-1-phosphate uridylyltransferase n=1 Tax=Scylla paramamosain TaxID=85552 RepID=A0AAW0TAH5_SCYPA
MATTLSPVVKGDPQRRPSMDAFKQQTKVEARVQLSHELDRLLLTSPATLKESARKEFEGFEKLFARFISDFEPSIHWDEIQKLEEGTIRSYSEIQGVSATKAKSLLDRLVVVKLNGGIGDFHGV